ncbi:predicted protein [Chaetomium globosum CBS 148.51]|uniref:Uncharacterized protein n=1 Tax=Chaetomium globosum (strain ATCC 6205 / CBS 148.51 / DSM 1962 / NBRC 6347 / NRRL 1970) TaxID=306901 RepID=Q2H8B3_CHAGB|nr:uncharacterized protein CHGG_03541 [Chaetomium globosum CBS 148.51]EAQ91606.1 predicted protein [Chaetomium globosum CBS 148.51]
MMSFHSNQLLLIQLHATIHYRRGNAATTTAAGNPPNPFRSHKLPPVTFTANTAIPSPSYDSAITDDPLNSFDSFNPRNDTHNPGPYNRPSPRAPIDTSTPPDLFLRSIDTACLTRVRAMTQHTAYRFDRPVNYEVERAFVWAGVAGGDEWMGMGAAGLGGFGLGEGSVSGGGAGHEAGGGGDGGDGAGAGGVGAGGVGAGTASLSMRGLSSAEITQQVDMMRLRGYRDWVRVKMEVEIEPGRELRKREAAWLTGGRGQMGTSSLSESEEDQV